MEYTDCLWLLSSATGKPPRKVWTLKDGVWTKSAAARRPDGSEAHETWWLAQAVPVDGPDSLFRVVRAAARAESPCIAIRGEWKGGGAPDAQGRLCNAAGKLLDVPRRKWREGEKEGWTPAADGRRWIALDVDKVPLPAALRERLEIEGPTEAGLRAAAEFVRSQLPAEWRGARALVAFSSSAGMDRGGAIEPGRSWTEVSAHVWLWLSRPVHDEVLAARKEKLQGAGLDASISNPVQPLYLSAPEFKGGADPLGELRWIELPGDEIAGVPDWLPPIEVHREQVERERAEQEQARLQAAHERQRRVRRRTGRAAASGDGYGGLREAYNAAVDLSAELDRLCEPAGGGRWTWPGASSEGGIMLHQDNPGIWVCWHDSAGLRERGGDAFSLLGNLECGGDWHRASEIAREVTGWTETAPDTEPAPETPEIERKPLAAAEVAVEREVDRAIDRAGEMTLVRVDAGVGKSRAQQWRIAEEFIAEMERRDYTGEPFDAEWTGRRFVYAVRDGKQVEAAAQGVRRAVREVLEDSPDRAAILDAMRDNMVVRGVRRDEPGHPWHCDRYEEWSRLMGASPEAARNYCTTCAFQGECPFTRNVPAWKRGGAGAWLTVGTLASLDHKPPGEVDVLVIDESPEDHIAPALTVTPGQVGALVDGDVLVVTRDGTELSGKQVERDLDRWAEGDAPAPWEWRLGHTWMEAREELAREMGANAPAALVPETVIDEMKRAQPTAPKMKGRRGEDEELWTWTLAGWNPLSAAWSGAAVVVLDATAGRGSAALIAAAMGRENPHIVDCAAQWADGLEVIGCEIDTHRLNVGDRAGHPQWAGQAQWRQLHRDVDATAAADGGEALHVTHKKLGESEHHPRAAETVATWGGKTMHHKGAGIRGTNDGEHCTDIVLDAFSLPGDVLAAFSRVYQEKAGLSEMDADEAAFHRGRGDYVQALHRVRPIRNARRLWLTGKPEYLEAMRGAAGLPAFTRRVTREEIEAAAVEQEGFGAGAVPSHAAARWLGRKIQSGETLRPRTSKRESCINTHPRARKAGSPFTCPPSIDGALRLLGPPAKWTASLSRAVEEAGLTVTQVSTDRPGPGQLFIHRSGEWPAEAVEAELRAEGVVWYRADAAPRRWLVTPPAVTALRKGLARIGARALARLLARGRRGEAVEVEAELRALVRELAPGLAGKSPDTAARLFRRWVAEAAEWLDVDRATALLSLALRDADERREVVRLVTGVQPPSRLRLERALRRVHAQNAGVLKVTCYTPSPHWSELREAVHAAPG